MSVTNRTSTDAAEASVQTGRALRIVEWTSVAAIIVAAAGVVLLFALGDPTASTARQIVFVAAVVVGLAAFAFLSARAVRRDRMAETSGSVISAQLMAVLDAVDEAIVLRDSTGVRLVNRRAGELFGIDPDTCKDHSFDEVVKELSLKMEDPDAFVETLQAIPPDSSEELRVEVEQIIPARRQLRLYSRPTRDALTGAAGRIDVYTDVTEALLRAREIERLYERASSVAESYQRGLLPQTAPSLPRVSLVSHYVSCSGERTVCGDFYDFVPLPEGRIGLVLGDVCGNGPAAANDAALCRYSLRSFATGESDAGELFRRLNEHVTINIGNERFIRVLMCVLDPERAELEYVNAGHVPPVIYRASSGEVEWLSEGGIVLGVEQDARYKPAYTQLQPGDTLVLYSDGVTEAPRFGRPFGQGKFSDIVSDYGVGTAGELIQAIRRAVEAWVPTGELRDDIALLVCEVVPDEAIHEPTRELVIPNEAARIGEVRSFVSGFLADVRAPVDASLDILIAVGEAAANASRHGRRAEGQNEIRVRCNLEGGAVKVTVVDEGSGFDTTEMVMDEPPDRFASGGRGLFLMSRLVDDVAIESSQEGTRVVLEKSLDSGSQAAQHNGGGGEPLDDEQRDT